jgi:hypothetical protein
VTSTENSAAPVGDREAARPVTFYSTRSGAEYVTSDPAEIIRLRAARGHTEDRAEVSEAVGGSLFDPSAHDVSAVIEYLSTHTEDYQRVVEAERAGKNRKSIVGE